MSAVCGVDGVAEGEGDGGVHEGGREGQGHGEAVLVKKCCGGGWWCASGERLWRCLLVLAWRTGAVTMGRRSDCIGTLVRRWKFIGDGILRYILLMMAGC